MKRSLRRFTLFAVLVAAIPSFASAALDVACGANATSVVAGRATNVAGDPVQGALIQLRQANKDTLHAQTTTAANGTYKICTTHDTYDVRADTGSGGLYATANQTITTFTNPAKTTDFVLEYKLNQTITPQAVSIPVAGSSTSVTWRVQSKAPAGTQMRLTLDHLGATVLMSAAAPAGGWNIWTYTAVLAHPLPEGFRWAKVAGYDASNRRITELGQDPYLVDNQAPRFGPATTGSVDCGGSHLAGPFTPFATTNPWALITVGVCDPESNFGRSSLDPYTVSAQIFDPNGNPVTTGSLILNQLSIQYLPSGPMSLGTYQFRFSIRDHAGNLATSPQYALLVEKSGGSVPTLSGFVPGNLGEGSNLGIVIGSGFTTPASRAVVAFYAKDADGQGDLSFGSLRVRVYGPDGNTLLYDYDSSLPPVCSPVQAPPGNTGCFNQGTGRFEASGFSLFGRPPGLYSATASISDHSGNSVTRTWRWFQVLTL
ncbi:MAG TPA: hypothetical protein VM841_06430 [Actinomycetota bacterium]|nr:hypothetical protein [Actinomycetota bacterium]